MTTTAIALIESKYAENAETTQYTSTNCKTIIDKFTATNITAANHTITVRVVTSGGSAGASNALAYNITISAGKSYQFPEIVGHTLESGDFISTLPDAASAITIRASGRQITS